MLGVNCVLLSSFWLVSFGSGGADAASHRESVERLKADVYYLASETLEGRGISTPGIDLASRHIAAEFKRIGLKAGTTDGGYFQPFVYGKSESEPGITLNNVIGVIEGEGALASETIVIGAHYDHLGHVEPKSTTAERRIFSGADDNASGVAAMMELARRFAARKEPPRRRMVFIAFCAEESGRAGSQYYASKSPVFPIKDTTTMVNFDMVGRIRERELGIAGDESAKEFGLILKAADDKSRLRVRLGGPEYPNDSDHASFASVGIPILYICTGSHSERHTPADTADKIDFDGIELVVSFVEDVLDRLLAAGRPAFVPPKRAR